MNVGSLRGRSGRPLYRRHRWRTAGSAALIAALLLAACGGSDESAEADPPAPVETAADADPSDTADPTATATAAPTPTAPAVTSALLDLPPHTIAFGNVDFSIVGLELSNADPDSRLAGLDLPSTRTYLYVDIGVANPTENATLTLNERDFVDLRLGDALFSTQLRTDDISPISLVQPGVTGTYHAFFEVPSPFDQSGAELVFGGTTREQAVLSLNPQAPLETAATRAVSIPLVGDVDGRVVCGPSRLRVSVASAVQSIDLPADLRSTGGLPQRAATGEVFVEVTVAFEVLSTGGGGGVAGGGGCTGTIVSDELIQLSVDGVLETDHYIEGDGDIEAQEGDTVAITTGFMVPAGAEPTLTIGNTASETASAPFALER